MIEVRLQLGCLFHNLLSLNQYSAIFTLPATDPSKSCPTPKACGTGKDFVATFAPIASLQTGDEPNKSLQTRPAGAVKKFNRLIQDFYD